MTNLSNKLSLLPNRKASRTQSRKLKGVIATLTCSLFFSCENPALYDQYQAINNITWEKDKEYYFTFEVKDISVPYDLTLEVRNNNLYPYQNLYQSSFPIHSQYKFPHAGQYTFSFRQGMRDDALKGIQEIGFSVRPAK